MVFHLHRMAAPGVTPGVSLTALPTTTDTISPRITSFISRQIVRLAVASSRDLYRREDIGKDSVRDDNRNTAASSSDSGAPAESSASNSISSFTNCDGGDLFCPVGSCYSGVNGYIGCCTASSCAARTTCIPYHAGQKSCDEDTEGCVFCSNPATPYCYRFENWDAEPTAFAMWCTDFPSTTAVFYHNTVTYQTMADLPFGTFTPSWPITSSPSTSATTSPSSPSPMTSAVADATSTTTTNNTTADNFSPNLGINLSVGAIIGISVGGLIAVLFLTTLAIYFIRRIKDKKPTEQDTMQQPRGTLGGAVLPGSWFGGKRLANQNEIIDHQSRLGSIRMVPQPEVSIEGSANPELGDTGIAAYSTELSGANVTVPAAMTSSCRPQTTGARPVFIPYSPANISQSDPPYASQHKSSSGPGFDNQDSDQGPSQVHIHLDGQNSIQNVNDQLRTRDPIHAFRTAYHPTNFAEAQRTIVVSQAPNEPSPLSTQSGMVSPVSTSINSHTPLFQRIIALQPGAITQHPGSEARDSWLTVPSENGSYNAASEYRKSQPLNEFTIDQSTSLSSHPTHGEVSSPLQQPSEAAVSSSIDATEPLLSTGSSRVANTRVGPELPNSGLQRGVSARGGWEGWVSPESAYTDGLWEKQAETSDKQDEESGLEQGKKEKKD